MSVDYTIQLPSNTALNIENSFGGIEVPDYNGPVSINSKYGHLTAGKLAKPQTIAVEFGKADIKSIGNIDLDFKYSTITIDNLTGNCKLKMSFCSYSKISLDNGLTGLTVNDSYSSVHLDPAPNLSAAYTIHTSYGSFVDKTDIGIKRTDSPEKYGPDLNKTYEGKSGSGNVKIDIKSSFGNIMIGKGTKEDMKEKKESDHSFLMFLFCEEFLLSKGDRIFFIVQSRALAKDCDTSFSILWHRHKVCRLNYAPPAWRQAHFFAGS